MTIYGCGPVGLFSLTYAFLLGAGRVLAINPKENRLAMASTHNAPEYA